MKYSSYREQLLKLPDVFTLAESRRILEYNTETMHKTLSRWMASGLIKTLAPRSGVYFNILKNKNAEIENLKLAISKKYPITKIVGAHVLANYGWTTQIQQYLNLVVNIPPIKGSTSSNNGYLDIENVDISYRSKKWWLAAKEDQQNRDKNNIVINGFDSVSPAFALVDMWTRREKEWFPYVDDLDFQDRDVNKILNDIRHAALLLNVDDVEDMLNYINLGNGQCDLNI